MSRITAIILVLLSLGIYYTFTSPQLGNVAALSAQAGEYRNALENASRISSTRDQLASDAETIPSAERERLMKALPNGVDSVGLARELDGIASRYGIIIQSVAIDNTVGDDLKLITLPEGERPYERTAVSFSFISNYLNFVKFLSDLEKSLRIMDVRSSSFTISENGLYEHKITVDTYWLK